MAVLPCPHLVLSVIFVLAIPVKTSLEMKSLFFKAETMPTVPTSLPCSSPTSCHRREPQDPEWRHNGKLEPTIQLGLSPVGMNHSRMEQKMELSSMCLVEAEQVLP